MQPTKIADAKAEAPGFTQGDNWLRKIKTLYSADAPEGIRFSLEMKVLYNHFEGWKRSGKECYETIETFCEVCDKSKKVVIGYLDSMVKLGILEKTKRGRGFFYKSLPITDSHLSPPSEAEQEQAPPLEVVQVETNEDPQQRLIKFMDWDFFTQNVLSSHDNLSGYLSAIVQREEGREDTQEIKDFTSWYIQYKRDAAKQRIDYLKTNADAF